MKLKVKNPKITNVYPKSVGVWHFALAHPEMAMHLIGQNVNTTAPDHVIWAPDCLWVGVAAVGDRRFQTIQISGKICEKFGYQAQRRQSENLRPERGPIITTWT